MERAPVSSSVLRSVGYDKRSSTLEVEFEDGDVYRYFLVPPRVFAGLMATADAGESVGRYFNEHVKAPGYPFEQR